VAANDPQDGPLELIAELTHRCPLGCPYCSNPLALEGPEHELDASTWARVFREAAALGVRRVQLSGGEPGARRDLVDIAAHAHEAGLQASLITSGVGISTRAMRDLWEAGLDQVQVSFQDADAVAADRIAGRRGAFQRKRALAAEAVRLGLPLTVGLVVHRGNIGRIATLVDLALALKAGRVEIAAVRYLGWALKNRAALLPSAQQLDRAIAEIDELRHKHRGRLVIEGPAAADGGRRQRMLSITPSGRVLPGGDGEPVADFPSWNVRDHPLAEIWRSSPAFGADGGSDLPIGSDAAADHDTPPRMEAYSYRRM
jgi:pyrroloquinoline quinone biosynthesis protein E